MQFETVTMPSFAKKISEAELEEKEMRQKVEAVKNLIHHKMKNLPVDKTYHAVLLKRYEQARADRVLNRDQCKARMKKYAKRRSFVTNRSRCCSPEGANGSRAEGEGGKGTAARVAGEGERGCAIFVSTHAGLHGHHRVPVPLALERPSWQDVLRVVRDDESPPEGHISAAGLGARLPVVHCRGLGRLRAAPCSAAGVDQKPVNVKACPVQEHAAFAFQEGHLQCGKYGQDAADVRNADRRGAERQG